MRCNNRDNLVNLRDYTRKLISRFEGEKYVPAIWSFLSRDKIQKLSLFYNYEDIAILNKGKNILIMF